MTEQVLNLETVVENNKVTNLIIVNPGIGYSTANTTISIVSAGKNAIFDPQIRSLSVKRNTLFNDVSESIDEAQEILISSNRNLQYAVCGYSDDSIDVFGDDGSTHSPIIGWAYDGNPIYGSFGYSDPQNINSTLKRLVPGYSKSSSYISDRPSIVNFAEGYFEEDYRFTDSGDLDEYNGRWCITPEFPEGVYAYFATKAFLMVIQIMSVYSPTLSVKSIDLDSYLQISLSIKHLISIVLLY